MMNRVFLLLISGAIVFTSFSGRDDFGRGKFQLQGRIFIDTTLLMDDTVYILPVDIFFKADSAEAELLYVNKNGNFDYTVNFVTPCLSGGTMWMCRNKGLTEDACWKKLFRQCNYQFLEFSCRKKKFRYNFVPHAMEEYFYEKKLVDFKNFTPKTFTQDILLN